MTDTYWYQSYLDRHCLPDPKFFQYETGVDYSYYDDYLGWSYETGLPFHIDEGNEQEDGEFVDGEMGGHDEIFNIIYNPAQPDLLFVKMTKLFHESVRYYFGGETEWHDFNWEYEYHMVFKIVPLIKAIVLIDGHKVMRGDTKECTKFGYDYVKSMVEHEKFFEMFLWFLAVPDSWRGYVSQNDDELLKELVEVELAKLHSVSDNLFKRIECYHIQDIANCFVHSIGCSETLNIHEYFTMTESELISRFGKHAEVKNMQGMRSIIDHCGYKSSMVFHTIHHDLYELAEEMILNGIKVTADILTYAIDMNKGTVIDLLMKHYRGRSCTPLYAACRTGNHDLVSRLLSILGALNEVEWCRYESPLVVAIKRQNIDIVQTLLGYGANAQHALDSAIQTGNMTIVNLLCEYGADCRKYSYIDNYSPVLQAVRNADWDMALHLVGLGIKIDFDTTSYCMSCLCEVLCMQKKKKVHKDFVAFIIANSNMQITSY